jgi:tetratricopeptide (TPR) repeat protein
MKMPFWKKKACKPSREQLEDEYRQLFLDTMHKAAVEAFKKGSSITVNEAAIKCMNAAFFDIMKKYGLSKQEMAEIAENSARKSKFTNEADQAKQSNNVPSEGHLEILNEWTPTPINQIQSSENIKREDEKNNSSSVTLQFVGNQWSPTPVNNYEPVINFAKRNAEKGKREFIGWKYEVYSELGRGGYGVVNLVYSHETKEVYALKTFKDEFLENVETRNLFLDEARIWTNLEKHPYLVKMKFVDKIAGRHYLAMDYIRGSENGFNSLQSYFEKQPPDLAQSLRWAIQFCYGMEYANSRKIICHRDIKPTNILITEDKTIKISDFGLAAIATRFESNDINKTQNANQNVHSAISGQGFGSPAYIPPEQFIDASKCDVKSDIYSFGIVLFQMATRGQLPFECEPPADRSEEEWERYRTEMFSKHCSSPIPEIDSPLFPIIKKCLGKKPEERGYRNFAELRNELEPILMNLTGETIPPPIMGGTKSSLDWLQEGSSLDAIDQSERAIQCFDEALRMDPNNVGALENKARSLERLDDLENALLFADKALAISPFSFSALNTKGIVFYEKKRFDDAINNFDKAIKINYFYERPWTNKGIVLNQLGKYHEATVCFENALKLNPKHEEAWNNIGVCLMHLEQFHKALEYFDQALQINPENSGSLLNKGCCFQKLNRNDESLSICTRYLQLNPNSEQGWIYKGHAFWALNRFEEAYQCFEKATEINPQNYDAWFKKAGISSELKNLETAETCLNKVLEIDPLRVDAWVCQGALLNHTGKIEQAIHCCQKALEIDPRSKMAAYFLGYALNTLGRFDEALGYFDITLGSDSNFTEAWLEKGESYCGLGMLEQAISCYDVAIKCSPENYLGWFNKGNTLMKLDRNDQAIECYDQSLAIYPNHAEGWNNKGLSFYYLGRYDEALEILSKSVTIDPKYANAWYHKGIVLDSLNRFDEAIQCFDNALSLNPNHELAMNFKGECLIKKACLS